MKKLVTKRNVLILIAVIFFFIAWNRSINLLYGMFALLTATLILSLVLPRLSLRTVAASRTLPSAAFEGETIELSVNVENRGRWGRSMLQVVDSFPAAGPDFQNPMTFVARLRRRASRHYTYSLECYKRGEYQIGPLRMRSAYPLGIANAEKTTDHSLVPFLVYPRVFEIPSLPLVSASSTPMSGVEAAGKAGGSEEFFGTREYRRGDSLRHIHWPSTARHGELIVKEFEVRAATEVTIVLDLHARSEVGAGKETTLEYAVKIATSIAQYALLRGHAIQLAGYGEREHIVPFSRGVHHLAAVLENMARVRATGSVPYAAAVMRAADLMRDGGTTVLIMTREGARGKEFPASLNLLRTKRMRLLCVVIDEGTFLERPRRSMPVIDAVLLGLGASVYVVSKGDDLPGVFAQ